jgi:hypothetical protein
MDRRKQTKQKMERKNTGIEDDIWKGMDGRKEGWMDGRTEGQTDR